MIKCLRSAVKCKPICETREAKSACGFAILTAAKFDKHRMNKVESADVSRRRGWVTGKAALRGMTKPLLPEGEGWDEGVSFHRTCLCILLDANVCIYAENNRV